MANSKAHPIDKPKHKNKIFTALYTILSIVIFVIGFFGVAYFSYDWIDPLVSNLILIICIILMFIIAIIQVVLSDKCVTAKTIDIIFYSGNILIFGLRFFSDFFVMGLFCFNSIMAIIYCIVYFHPKRFNTYKSFFDKKIILIIAFIAILLYLGIYSRAYLIGNVVLLYAFIPMAVIFCVFVGLSLSVFLKTFNQLAQKKWTKVGVFIIVLFIGWFYGVIFIDTINSSIPSPYSINSYEIVDKKINGTGARQVTTYDVYFVIDDNTYHIDVSVDFYWQCEIGDMINIKTTQGALNLSYMEVNY